MALSRGSSWRDARGGDSIVRDRSVGRIAGSGPVGFVGCTVARNVSSYSTLVTNLAGGIERATVRCGTIAGDVALI